MSHKPLLSIWFFCGILMLAYGLVLDVQGVVEFHHLPATVLARLHPTLWWGLLLTVAGGIYTLRFRPIRYDVEPKAPTSKSGQTGKDSAQ